MLKRLMSLMAAGALTLGCGSGLASDETPNLSGVAWIKRVSTTATGAQTDRDSYWAIFRPGHAQVAFATAARLESTDANGDGDDVFLKSIGTGAVRRVSTDAHGKGGDGNSSEPSFFPDGDSVLFTSTSRDFAANLPYGLNNIFVKNLKTGAIRLVSTSSNGALADGSSWWSTASPDGNLVAFESQAANMIANDTNGVQDIFVKNLTTGKTTRVSTSGNGAQANGDSFLSGRSQGFSPDGTRLLFISAASNLVAGDTNGKRDVFVKNLVTGAVQRVSTSAAGKQTYGHSWSAVWSADGKSVAFAADASHIVSVPTPAGGIFLKNLETGAIELISTSSNGTAANYGASHVALSPNGRFAAFDSSSTNLVAGDTNGQADIFVKDLETGKTIRVNKSASGAQANNASAEPTFSSDSTMVEFKSRATNLVAADTTANWDIFVVKLK